MDQETNYDGIQKKVINTQKILVIKTYRIELKCMVISDYIRKAKGQ